LLTIAKLLSSDLIAVSLMPVSGLSLDCNIWYYYCICVPGVSSGMDRLFRKFFGIAGRITTGKHNLFIVFRWGGWSCRGGSVFRWWM